MSNEIEFNNTNLQPDILLDSLKKVGDELQSVVKETEKEFLSVGSNLRDFHGRSVSISSMSSGIAQLFTGTEITDSIDRLEKLVTRMKETMDHSRHETGYRIEKLKYLNNTISNIDELFQDTKMSIKSLKMLELTIRIYINRAVSFNLLAAEIKRLASDITVKTASILDRLRTLNDTIKQTLTKVHALNDIQQNRGQQILEYTMKSLESLKERHDLSVTIADDISKLSEETSRSIGEVVKFLQFHDIIYQQIGQIRNGFTFIQKNLGDVKGKEDPDNTGAIEIIYKTGLFCHHQALQLHKSRDNMQSAVKNIIGNLQIINRNIKSISQDTKNLTGDADEKKQTFLSGTRKSLSAVTSAITALAENAKVSKQLSKATSSAVLDEIATLLNEIKPIEEQIELIALNAVVTAANTDSGGEVLSVIAESVQKVAMEVGRQTGAILHIFGSMKSVTDELSSDIDSESQEDAQIYDMVSESELLKDSFNRVSRDITSLLTSVQREGQTLSGDIQETTRSIYIYDIFSMACDNAIRQMEHISSVSRSMVSGMGYLEYADLSFGMMEALMTDDVRKGIGEEKSPAMLTAEKDNRKETHFETNVELF
jgi:methyl-accepting chemotaxis protein